MSAYTTAVLADSPRHYWRLADPGGVLVHDLGSAPIALLTNSNYPAGLPYLGPISDGGSFVGQAVAYPWMNEDVDAMAAPLTLELLLWQHSDIAVVQIAFIVRTGASPFFIAVNTTPAIYCSGPSVTIVNPTALVRQTWKHVVAVFPGAGNGTLYVNGSSVGTASLGVPPSGNYRFGIGGNVGSAGNQFQGALAECAVYTTALSAARVTAHFNAVDQITQRPIFSANGAFPTSSGGTSTDVQQLATIIAAVQTTYQNSP